MSYGYTEKLYLEKQNQKKKNHSSYIVAATKVGVGGGAMSPLLEPLPVFSFPHPFPSDPTFH